MEVAARQDPVRAGRRSSTSLSGWRADGSDVTAQGVTTGQAVAPLVVHTIRPWIAGLIGELAAT